jgi:hypothetical protein
MLRLFQPSFFGLFSPMVMPAERDIGPCPCRRGFAFCNPYGQQWLFAGFPTLYQMQAWK